ncbi:MAG: hypothetical protein KAS72_00445 [Phycisphaerales bacterium]|nr:hypothetical protein [Phycisphaerales bacterium]
MRRSSVLKIAIRGCAVLMLAVMGIASPGCLAELVGGMAASAERLGSHEVAYEYGGLQGKTFAVMVNAGREVQYEYPGVLDLLAEIIATSLAENAGATGLVPASRVRWYQTSNPHWGALTYSELTEALGIERLILVDIYDYRLHEPGNPYLWDGVASAKIGVIEADSAIPNEFMFERDMTVSFPGKPGFGPMDISQQDVLTGLNLKFAQRVVWLFYDHEEPNYEG